MVLTVTLGKEVVIMEKGIYTSSPKGTGNSVGKNSQEMHLKKIIRTSVIALVIGGIFLAISIATNLYVMVMEEDRLETTRLLDQYRLGSKALTYAVQAYAVTGDTKYYDDYMRELTTDKTRDKAWEGLEKNNITQTEWDEMKRIAALSDALVPLEEQAMTAVKNGKQAAAIDYVFGDQYEHDVEVINDQTNLVINQIQDRLDAKKNRLIAIQSVVEVLFLFSFLYVIRQIMVSIKFSREELLVPIIKVSDQMVAISDGNFHEAFDMKEDDSEVGKMVTAIQFMKNNLVKIIREITSVLEQMGEGNYEITKITWENLAQSRIVSIRSARRFAIPYRVCARCPTRSK